MSVEQFPIRGRAEMIPMLLDFLALAKAGEIECVAMVAIKPDGDTICAVSDPGDCGLKLVGATALLAHRVVDNHDEGWGE